jgi:hypothetical protein
MAKFEELVELSRKRSLAGLTLDILTSAFALNEKTVMGIDYAQGYIFFS